MRTRALVPAASFLSTLTLALTAAADPTTVHLRVDGPVDRAVLASRLADELGVRILNVADGAPCAEPCLAIDVADVGATATVAYADAGAHRARTVVLGDDDAIETLVLLAGNVARDEAADLLAAMAPPAPTPSPALGFAPAETPVVVAAPGAVDVRAVVAATPAPDPERAPEADRSVGFGFCPILSADFTAVGRVRHDVSLDLVIGFSGGAGAITMSGVADLEAGPVDGVQLGGAVAFAPSVGGAQLAGALAVAGDVGAIQMAGAMAVARNVRGAQLAGAVAITTGDAGTQLAGALAVARDVDGAQLAGAVATARDVRGAQVAGAVNLARDVDGVQVAGAVNIARRARVQLGVVNVADDPDVVQIGVFGYVKNGRTDLEATVDAAATGAILLRHGGRRWHAVYGVGGQRAKDTRDEQFGESREDMWMYGLGMGPSWDHGDVHTDVELMAWQVNHGTWHDDDVSLLAQLRATLSYDLGNLAVVAGASVNTYIDTAVERGPIQLSLTGDLDEPSGIVRVWPSAFVGVRL